MMTAIGLALSMLVYAGDREQLPVLGNYHVKGTVVVAGGAVRAVEGALIEALAQGAMTRAVVGSARSAANGEFDLRFRAESCVDGSAMPVLRISHRDSGSAVITRLPEHLADVDLGPIVLAPPLRVQVVVYDQNESPVSGATVSIQAAVPGGGDAKVTEDVTSLEGKAHLEVSGASAVIIGVSATGFRDYRRRWDVASADAQEGLTVRLAPASSRSPLFGRVSAADRAPIANALVAAQVGGRSVFETLSGVDGEFSIPAPAAQVADYVMCYAMGYVAKVLAYDRGPSMSVSLESSWIVTVRARRGVAGDPALIKTVMLLWDNPNQMGESEAPLEVSRLGIENPACRALSHGTWQIELGWISPRGRRSAPRFVRDRNRMLRVSVLDEAGWWGDAEIGLAPDRKDPVVDVRLDLPLVLTGRVIDGNEAPVSQASVEMWGQAVCSQCESVVSGGDGCFSFPALGRGAYSLVATRGPLIGTLDVFLDAESAGNVYNLQLKPVAPLRIAVAWGSLPRCLGVRVLVCGARDATESYGLEDLKAMLWIPSDSSTALDVVLPPGEYAIGRAVVSEAAPVGVRNIADEAKSIMQSNITVVLAGGDGLAAPVEYRVGGD